MAVPFKILEVNVMTKADLISSMAEKCGCTKKDAEKALAAFLTSVTDALASGDKVQIVGFGTFEVRDRKEKESINPKTKEKIIVPAKKAPAFKPGKAFKDAVEAK
jgi:DNA-binding protein HU-beta